MSRFTKRSGETQMQVESVEYAWIIHKFSLRASTRGAHLFSPGFSSGPQAQTKWCICLYPSGEDSSCSGYVSVFLSLMCGVPTWIHEVSADYELSIKTADGTRLQKTRLLHQFDAKCIHASHGAPKFILRSQLLDRYARLLTDDTLTLVCRLIASYPDAGSGHKPERVAAAAAEATAAAAAADGLAQDLRRLLQDPSLADVTLVVGDARFSAHKCMLACRSPVFAAMFAHPTRERADNCVIITDARPDAIEQMLHFIYGGQVHPLSPQMAGDLLAVASKYQVMSLLSLCEEHLRRHLSEDSAVEALILADRHSVAALKAQALAVVAAAAARSLTTDAWDRLRAHPDLLVEVCQALVRR